MAEQLLKLRTRFWVESVLAALTGGLFVLTFFRPAWLETFGFDPDGGSGAAEWASVGLLASVSIAFAVAARFEWRRTAATPA